MIENRVGQRVPDITFRIRQNDAWRSIETSELFAGRTVVLFALPGAFTPTCSSTHLPRYDQLAGAFEKAGVDEIICLSVNDAFVMDEWARAQGARHVRLLADGNGDFTRGMGALVDKSDLGFGPRSWRYSMLVRDGVIEQQFIEPEVEGDPFEVSDADTMLRWLAPDVAIPAPVALITRPGCPHCERARRALRENGFDYEELVLGRDLSTSGLEALTGRSTSPQVFVGGEHVGGADDLEAWLAQRPAA